MTPLISEIKKTLPRLKLLENEPMSRHCSFRIGGPAAALAIPANQAEFIELCAVLRRAGELPLILGNGTNLLVSDGRIDKIVIKTEQLCAIEQSGNELSVQCGTALARLAVFAQKSSLSGLEFAHGIPGSLGGAVSMNAGAYGGEMKDVVISTSYLDDRLELKTVHGDAHEFSYRHSMFSGTPFVILDSRLSLSPGDGDEIRRRMDELVEKRRASQPLDKPSAGSTFKRPETGYAAAMIDQAGLKGFQIGGAAVSVKHAGFVVNLGGATFDDVRRVMAHIQETVYSKFGVRLEPEVKMIG